MPINLQYNAKSELGESHKKGLPGLLVITTRGLTQRVDTYSGCQLCYDELQLQ